MIIRRFNKRKSDQRGFSMMGMVVSISLLGILTAGTVAVIQQLSSTQSLDRFRNGAETLVHDVAAELSSKTACLNSLQPAGGPSLILDAATNTSLTSLKNSSNANVAILGGQQWDPIVQLSSIRVDRYDATSNQALLTLSFTAAGTMAGGQTLTRTIPLAVRRDEVTHALVECRALVAADADIWRGVAGSHDMAFTMGKIGIGTGIPQATLDVNGEIRIGQSAGLACAPTSEGLQRYNRTSKRMEFCNGTAWTPLGP